MDFWNLIFEHDLRKNALLQKGMVRGDNRQMRVGSQVNCKLIQPCLQVIKGMDTI